MKVKTLATMKVKTLATYLVFGLLASDIFALPVDVSFTVSGSPGNYDLDFTVQNNMTAWSGQAIYTFGVQLNEHYGLSIPASPSMPAQGWYDYGTRDNSGQGGSSIIYNNVWNYMSCPYLLPGMSLSGFVVHFTDATAPSSVPWFLYAWDVSYTTPYTGGDNFNNEQNPGYDGEQNPGFEGVVVPSVPDAGSSLYLLSGAFALMGVLGRKFRK
jgi:hypothetical protein